MPSRRRLYRTIHKCEIVLQSLDMLDRKLLPCLKFVSKLVLWFIVKLGGFITADQVVGGTVPDFWRGSNAASMRLVRQGRKLDKGCENSLCAPCANCRNF